MKERDKEMTGEKRPHCCALEMKLEVVLELDFRRIPEHELEMTPIWNLDLDNASARESGADFIYFFPFSIFVFRLFYSYIVKVIVLVSLSLL